MPRQARIQLRPTNPQREFLTSVARNQAFIGGVGSGKTRASIVKALSMPRATIGMLVAPTYTMLRDTLIRTFRDIVVKQPEILRSFNRSDLRAQLWDDKEILFRSSDNPERLRGPNLAWAGLDEAALMKRETLDIMIGRLRLPPGRLWFTTTPKGRDHWTYDVISAGHFDVSTSKTMDNPYLPQEYIENLRQQYSTRFFQQEVLGEFITADGNRIKREWLRHGEPPAAFDRISMGVDLAISTKSDADYTAATVTGTAHGLTWILHSERTRTGFNGALHFIQAIAERYKPSIVAIESVQYQAAVVEQLLRTTNLPIQAIKPDRDKVTRFMPLEARYEQGIVWHAPGLTEYEDELLTFPSGKHDDLVDSAAYAYNALGSATPRVRRL